MGGGQATTVRILKVIRTNSNTKGPREGNTVRGGFAHATIIVGEGAGLLKVPIRPDWSLYVLIVHKSS